MGWLFREDITRKELIAERTESWERKSGETIVRSECLAKCFRGGGFSGVLWAVWQRRFTKDGEDVEPRQRWITCDLIQYRRDSGWGFKDDHGQSSSDCKGSVTPACGLFEPTRLAHQHP